MIVGIVSTALTLEHWCHGITGRQADGHTWNPLRVRLTEDFNVRDVQSSIGANTNSAVNPRCARTALLRMRIVGIWLRSRSGSIHVKGLMIG